PGLHRQDARRVEGGPELVVPADPPVARPSALPSEPEPSPPLSVEAAPRIDLLELVYLAVALAVGGAAWVALALAELGLFLGALGALASIAAGAVLAAVVLRGAHAGRAWRLGRAARLELVGATG